MAALGTVSAEDSDNAAINETNLTDPVEKIALPDPYNTRTGESFTTIQAAIDDADTQNGDTIQVEPGIYTEHVILNKMLNLIATGPNTIINGTLTITAQGSGSTVQGFTITNGTTTSTTIFSENFDSVTTPKLPFGWATIPVYYTSGNVPEWQTNVGTHYPSGKPAHSGDKLAYFNSWNADEHSSARLYRTIGLDLSGKSSAELSFWMYHDTFYSTSNDLIQVQVSPDGGNTWTNVGNAFPRFDGSTGWKKHNVDLSSYTGFGMNNVRIGFLGVSDYGSDCHIDDVTIDVPATDRLVEVLMGANNVKLQYLTITGGTANANGAGIYNQGGTAAQPTQLINCLITGNTATGNYLGGGIYNTGTLNMVNCEVTSNTAANGGGIYNYYGSVSIDNCLLNSNRALLSAGAIYSDHGTMNILNSQINSNTAFYASAMDFRDDQTSIINIKNSRIENNIGNDGAIQNYCDLTIENCIISGNQAKLSVGGAIVNYNDGVLTVKNTVFENNFAGNVGGAIYNENYRNVLFTDCQFTGNTACYGGAIFSDIVDKYSINPTLTVINSLISGNKATDSGGAAYNWNGPLVLNFNRIIANTAPTASNIYNRPEQATTNALYNWWGSNAGPDPSSLVNVPEKNSNPWLVMNYGANPTTILQGATSTLTADFRYDSWGVFHDPSLGHLPDGTPVTFTTNLGNVGSKSITVNTLNGIATAILRGDEAAGEALTSATLDFQVLYSAVVIQSTASAASAASTTRTIGMQSTGTPIAGLILAIFMVLSGMAVHGKK